MSRLKFLEKDIVHTDGFILIEKHVCIELREKKAFLTYKGENFAELTKEQASKIKLSLKPKRIRNRFKDRFLMKELAKNSEYKYRHDYTSRDFRASIWLILARKERENTNLKNIFNDLGNILTQICKN